MDLNIPNLQSLGLGNIAPIQNVPPVKTQAFYTKMMEASLGKIPWLVTGKSWVYIDTPFQTFTNRIS